MTIRPRLRPLHVALLHSVGTGLAGQGALAVSGILVARMLGVENRGHLALLNILPLLISQLGGLGIWLSVTFYVAREPSNTRGILRRLTRFVTLQALALTALHGLALLLVFGEETAEVRLAAALTILAVPASLAQLYGFAILLGQQRFRAFNVCRLVPVGLYASSTLAVFLSGARSLPIVTACYVGVVTTGAMALPIALRRLGPPAVGAGAPPLREMVTFGTRAILGSASPTDGFGLDQAAVGLFLSRGDLGLYVVGLAFTNLPRFVAQSIGMIAYPNVAAREDPRDARRALWRFFWVTSALCLAVVVGLELAVGWLIPFCFGESFSGAVGITRILLVSALLLSARRVLSDGARGAGEPGLGTAAEITSLVVLFPAMAVMTLALGVDGAATALAVASGAGLTAIAIGLWRARLGRPRGPLADSRMLAGDGDDAGSPVDPAQTALGSVPAREE